MPLVPLRLAHILLVTLALETAAQSGAQAQYGAWLSIKGDGTAMVFVSENDHTGYLIDGGRAGGQGIQALEFALPTGKTVGMLEMLYAKGVRDIRIACSHSHSDHTGAIISIVQSDPWMLAFDTIHFFESGLGDARLDKLYDEQKSKLMTQAEHDGVPISKKQGKPLHHSGADQDLYKGLMNPTANVWIENIPYEQTTSGPHGHAIVHHIQLRLIGPDGQTQTKDILEPDDADATTLQRVAAQLKERGVRLDYISIPHHGSANPDPTVLLDKSFWPSVNRPMQVVISANPNNRYDHPDPQTLAIILKAVGPENLWITGENGTILMRADKSLGLQTPDGSLRQYLTHVHPYAIDAQQELATAETKEHDASLALKRADEKSDPFKGASGGVQMAPTAAGLERFKARIAFLTAENERVAATKQLARYQEATALMLGETPLGDLENVTVAPVLAQKPVESWPPKSDDPRWNAPSVIKREPWQPTPAGTIRASTKRFRDVAAKYAPKSSTEGSVPPTTKAMKRQILQETTKSGKPGWGGITLGSAVEAGPWRPTEALAEIQDSLVKLAIRMKHSESGEVKAVSYRSVSQTEFWSAMQFVNPDDNITKETGATPGEVGLTSGETDANGTSKFTLHPAIEHTKLGFDAMRLDYSVYALNLRACQDDSPEEITCFKDLQLFKTKGWAYHWYDENMMLEVKYGELVVAPADKNHDSVLGLRFWSGESEKGKNIPVEDCVIPTVRKHVNAFTTLDRFARLVALLHWLDDHDIAIRGSSTIVPEHMAFDPILLPHEVAPHLWVSKSSK